MNKNNPNNKKLFEDSRNHLIQRISENINNCDSLVKQVVRGSKCNEIMSHCLQSMANQDLSIDSTEVNLKKLMDATIYLNRVLCEKNEKMSPPS